METENNKKNMDTNSENSSNASYHKYDRKTSFNLTVDDIQTLMTGKLISLTDASLECSLDDKAKTYLIGMIIEKGNGDWYYVERKIWRFISYIG